LDIIRNEIIREKVGVVPIEDKTREIRPRWFGHVKRGESGLVRSCRMFQIIDQMRETRRPSKKS